jgi:hypothetical protein
LFVLIFPDSCVGATAQASFLHILICVGATTRCSVPLLLSIFADSCVALGQPRRQASACLSIHFL